MFSDSMIEASAIETTGKFGTGFLTTHLLSRIVEVSGVYLYSETHRNFTLKLDRSPKTKPEMIAKYMEIKQRIETFDDPAICPVVENYLAGVNCDTSFKYFINNAKGRSTTERGINNFFLCVNYVLAFNPKFESITIYDNRTTI